MTTTSFLIQEGSCFILFAIHIQCSNYESVPSASCRGAIYFISLQKLLVHVERDLYNRAVQTPTEQTCQDLMELLPHRLS